jgi:UDP-3-O-[3-hydroxymyristoyl] glucosamine N-acyltransferase
MAAKEYTLGELAKLTNSQLVGNESHKICGVADLDSAGSQDVSFLANPRYTDAMHRSGAGVIFVQQEAPMEPGRNYLVTPDPSRAFQQILENFYAERLITTGFKGIHPTAVVHETAKIADGVQLGPHCVIDAYTTIDEGTSIGAGTYVGPFSSVGSHCHIHANVSIRERTVIGSRVVIQPGAVIGSCGFGLTTDASGKHEKLTQVGNVIIENDAEIGACTTIDRARFKQTRIGAGAKIDNLVQIAHGVSIGAHSIIVAQCGIAGSTSVGVGVVMGGQVGVAGHLKIADRTMLAAKTGVSKSLTKVGEAYGGAPAMPMSEFHRNTIYIRNLETYVNEIKSLKKKVEKLESH